MFSPDASLHGSMVPTSRNPRRRQRTGSSENGDLQPKKKQKRSALSQETFLPPQSSNGRVDGKTMNGHVHGGSTGRDVSSETRDLPVRGPKKHGERAVKGDRGTVLSKNDNCIVTQLPSLPDIVRANPKEPIQGFFSTLDGYALALTKAHALVWIYTSIESSPETFSCPIPEGSKHHSDALPLGCLVSKSASSPEPGLVLVLPSSGRVFYWESILGAATLDHTQKQSHGLEGWVGTMLSGESVHRIENAEPAGFILTFSTGRVAQLSVKDPQGRPALSTTFLRSGSAQNSVSLFSGLRNVFGSGGWRRDVAAARAGRSNVRGQRDVVVATSQGIIQIWDANWSGHTSLNAEVDAKEQIMTAFEGNKVASKTQENISLEVLDFTFVPDNSNTQQVVIPGASRGVTLLVLAASAGINSTKYCLIQLLLLNDVAKVTMVHPIRSYSTPVDSKSAWKPRVLLPEPAQTAFVVFDRATVTASVYKREQTPEVQLLMDAHRLPEPFEDIINLRKDGDYGVVGCGVEIPKATWSNKHDKRADSRHPSCILLVKEYGAVRITVFEQKEDPDATKRAKVTPKSKIEQAVFYGNMQHNLLDFDVRSEIKFPLGEVETAALQISGEILSSKSAFIPTITPSLDHQLKLRSTALRDLANHLSRNHPPLSRITKWKLMWDAEKMAAARAVWRTYDTHLKEKTGDRRSLLSHLVEMLHEDFKTDPVEELGEKDPVRQWFTRDIERFENIVPWAFNTIKELEKEGIEDPTSVLILISEANDLSLGALETAFNFRQQSASLYRLENESMEDGVLTNNYEGLPEFWTSTELIRSTTIELVKRARRMVTEQLNKAPGEHSSDPKLVSKVSEENVRQVQVCCQTYTERYRWLLAQSNEDSILTGKKLQASLPQERFTLIAGLFEIGLVDEAIALAEKYSDMSSLVYLVVAEMSDLSDRIVDSQTSEDDVLDAQERQEVIQDRIEGYFTTFGSDWARALYSNHIDHGQLSSLLNDHSEYQKYLTNFLREDEGYSKISWINDTLGEKDYVTAADTLWSLAVNQETDLWSKKVEMSLSKLAWLSVEDKKANLVDSEVALVNIQEKLYRHIAPALYGAIDQNAELELAMDRYGRLATARRSALQGLLEQGMSRLVRRECMGAEQLIDILTLMDTQSDVPDNEDDISGQEFFLALRVLTLSGTEPQAKERKPLTERVIWRRCMIRNDWESINNTGLKDDSEVEEAATATALFQTLKEGFKSDLFNDSSSFNILSPEDVLGAGSSAEDHRHRFQNDICEPLARDMRIEDEILQKCITDGRLVHWFPGIVDTAKKSVRDDADAAGEVAKKRKQMENSVAKKFAAIDRKTKLNGNGNGDVFMD
ncbi:MAG: hypothetical protein M1827_005464 [Pycnora praestabilis]|nr:MAG: hypothetical protein M1827_005464 [Pycnora praestabilis]